MPATLDRELETYEHELPSLLDKQGKFVVIHDGQVLGVFGDYEDALRAGYEKVGKQSFLVKRIERVETVQCFSRDIDLGQAPDVSASCRI